jgi:putative nucleotidyltransferase with HDIG domain
MLAIVRHAINDFEIVRGVVHPVAVFVVNVLPVFQRTTQHQLHDDPVNAGSSVFPLPTGVHVTSVIVDARTSSINNNVLFYFDLALVRNSDFVHDTEIPPSPQCSEVKIGDVFYHSLLVADRARELIEDLPYAKQVTVMLAALCHDFGKPATTEFTEGRLRSRGHEEAGVRPTESFLERLNIHTLEGYDVRSQVMALVRDHLKPGEFYKKREEVGDGAFRRLARRCELELLYRVARADSLGRNADWLPREEWFTAEAQEWFIERARELHVEEHPPAPLLMGRHLLAMGLKPGPRMGEITRAIYEMQLDGRILSLEEAKAAAQNMIGQDQA